MVFEIEAVQTEENPSYGEIEGASINVSVECEPAAKVLQAPAVLAIWTSARSEKSEYILAEGRKASGINDAARQRVTP